MHAIDDAPSLQVGQTGPRLHAWARLHEFRFSGPSIALTHFGNLINSKK
jgi:hypothetical protein